jgi:hypothetical protein
MLPVGCLGSLALMVLAGAAIAVIILGAIKSSWACSQGVDLARHNHNVVEKLGEPIETGWFVFGSIEVAGPTGDAHIAVPLHGPQNSGTLYVDAHKSAGQWQFDRAEVEVNGQEKRIDLLPGRADGRKTVEEFDAAIKSYPYEAPPPRKSRIVENYPKLAVGMSKDQVAGLIGEPDYSELDYGPKGPHEKWLGSHWMYWLRKRDSGVNMLDPCLEIFFGTDGRAHWIVPSNIAGLTEKGGARNSGEPSN